MENNNNSGFNDDGIKERVTIYVVAQAANVSLATVSRVINGKPNVTEKTRKVVQDTIDRLGYKPSALAMGLATSKSKTIGILMPNSSYVYTSDMLSGMVNAAKISGYRTNLFVTRQTKNDAFDVIENLIKSHVDGAIIYDNQLSTEEIMTIQNYKIPLVIIGHEMRGNTLASIVFEYKTALMSYLEKHFANGNGEDIVFLESEGDGQMMEELRTVVSSFCQEKNIGFNVLKCTDSYHRLYGQMPEWFEKNGKSGHFFIAGRDSLAAAVSNACIDAGIKIPEDNEVISVIGTKYSNICRPQISSMNIDMFMVGGFASAMLNKMMNPSLTLPEEDKILKIPAPFVQRESTRKDD